MAIVATSLRPSRTPAVCDETPVARGKTCLAQQRHDRRFHDPCAIDALDLDLPRIGGDAHQGSNVVGPDRTVGEERSAASLKAKPKLAGVEHAARAGGP